MQELRPGPELVQRTKAAFLAALQVRYSSPLFRLPTAAATRAQLRLHNTGPQQVLSARGCVRAKFSALSPCKHAARGQLQT